MKINMKYIKLDSINLLHKIILTVCRIYICIANYKQLRFT